MQALTPINSKGSHPRSRRRSPAAASCSAPRSCSQRRRSAPNPDPNQVAAALPAQTGTAGPMHRPRNVPGVAMRIPFSVFGAAVLSATSTMAADPATMNWSAVPSAELTLFYPGQSSYEWLRSDAHKGASRRVQRGDACVGCHDEAGAEKDLGDTLVKAGRLEPTPVAGKPGHVDLKVPAAFDD